MEDKSFTHWSPEEELSYNFFLICKADELLKYKNKAPGFYVQMSQFIPTRSKVQCRSHHQKMIGRFREVKQKAKQQLEELNLQSFYKDNYQIRLLTVDHLRKEIHHCLSKKVEEKNISKESYCSLKEKLEDNLHLLNLIEKETDNKKREQALKGLQKPQIETHDISEEVKIDAHGCKEQELLVQNFEDEPFNPFIIELSQSEFGSPFCEVVGLELSD